MKSNEYELDNHPEDSVTRIRFHPKDKNLLIASSWDGSMRLYDLKNNQMRGIYQNEEAVLDTTFVGSNGTSVVGGTGDGSVVV